jgi:hypothetical protein
MLLAALLAAASPAPDSCSFETAEPVTIEQLAQAPTKWLDRCVRLGGYAVGNAFYSDVSGFYRRRASDADERPDEGWLGLYLVDQGQRQASLRRAEAVGQLDDCDRLYDAAQAAAEPGAIIMMVGYCHYEDGPVLNRARLRLGEEAVFTRQTGEAARLRFGDLELAGAGRPVPPEVRRLVDSYMAAFRRGDLAWLRKFVVPYDQNEPEAPEEIRAFESLLVGATGPFEPLRKSTAALRPAYFQARAPKPFEGEEAQEGDWFACFCTAGDCEGRWPIAALDAGAREGLPYACLRIFRGVGKDGRLELGLDRSATGLVEPEAGPAR